jgi:hypothetical protein
VRGYRVVATLLTLLVAFTAGAAPVGRLDAVLLDASQLTRIERSQIKVDAVWWLDLDTRLLVAAAPKSIVRLEQTYPNDGVFKNVTPESFAYQSMACDERDAKMWLPALAKAGRGNLVLMPRNFAGYRTSSALVPITPNQDVISTAQRARSKALDPSLQPLIARIRPARWFSDLSTLASWKRNSFSPEIDLARDWLVGEFSGLGLSVSTPSFNVSGAGTTQIENVIATLPGTTLPDEWILIGAHYDSRNATLNNITNPSPGAEDNASGCAATLELARVLSDLRPKRTLKFMCFGGEEQNLYGSEAYAASLAASGDLGKIKLAVIMDMIGYSSTSALDVLLETSSALSSVLPQFQQAAADYSPGMTVTTSLQPFGSDHMPFINRGVPTLLLIENEWDTYPQYHKATDIPANVTNALLEGPAIIRMQLAVIAQRAEVELPFARDGFE